MPPDQNHGNLLSSWKEISEYLKCDVKTCQRWENSGGLPVHRVSGSARSRVFAYKEELDGWVKKRANGDNQVQEEPSRKVRSRLHLGLSLAVVGVGLLSLYVFFVRPQSKRVPVDFRIERSELVILDGKGRELWRYDTRLDGLEDEKDYRFSFQTKKPSPFHRGRVLPHLIIRDVNNDKRPEVLFAERTQDEMNAGTLICFNDRGRELWRFKAGREMKFGSRVYSNDYQISGFDAIDVNGDGKLETAVIGIQRPDWPTQLVLLDVQGRILGEYWNSGQLNDWVFADIDKNGKKEIILAGINNEYGKGCLLVFDPGRIEGGSPQMKDEFTCRELKPGSEEYYLLFPRTDVDQVTSPVEAVGKIDLLSGDRLSAEMFATGIYYLLNFNLTVEDIIVSHGFMQMHRDALQAHQIKSILDDKYREDLKKGFLFYDGRGWTPKPTPVRSGPVPPGG